MKKIVGINTKIKKSKIVQLFTGIEKIRVIVYLDIQDYSETKMGYFTDGNNLKNDWNNVLKDINNTFVKIKNGVEENEKTTNPKRRRQIITSRI